jgi:small-conductance mechanosensitive channel
MNLNSLLSQQHIYSIIAAIVILVVGIFLARKASQAVMRIQQLETQQKLLLQKATYYGLVILVIASALNQLGFDLKVLLGAAGLLTVAIGFAAQTSASNLISGLFLIIDRPFVVGDVIEVGGVKGEVIAIDLLSTKIRTFDNVLVRVPNETMNKSDIRNLTFFPIRRIDLKIGVGYNSDLTRVEMILRDVANRNPLCLQEPEPLFVFNDFGDSALSIQFSVWTLRENMTLLTAKLATEIRDAFTKNQIEIPFPHRTLLVSGGGLVPPPQTRV